MELTTVWFSLIAVLWIGYFCLEGFDFGVGMLLPGARPQRHRAPGHVSTPSGPVWDGNEVWVLVAGGATFAAFPEWYATLFSGFYLPLLLILVGADRARPGLRVPRQARRRPVAGPLGPRPHHRLGRARAAVGRRLRQHRGAGCRSTPTRSSPATCFTLLNPFGLLGGLVTLTLFAHPRRAVRGAQDRRRHPAPGPRARPADRRRGRGARGRLPGVDAGQDRHAGLRGAVRRSPRSRWWAGWSRPARAARAGRFPGTFVDHRAGRGRPVRRRSSPT